jgi:hypothetical protein
LDLIACGAAFPVACPFALDSFEESQALRDEAIARWQAEEEVSAVTRPDAKTANAAARECQGQAIIP